MLENYVAGKLNQGGCQVCQISVTLMSWDGWWVELDLFTTYFSHKVLQETWNNRLWVK